MTVFLLVVAFVAYFLPTIVAASRNVIGGGVLVVNLFFGWTLIGWLVAFIWACSAKTHGDRAAEQRHHAELMAVLKGPEKEPQTPEEKRAYWSSVRRVSR